MTIYNMPHVINASPLVAASLSLRKEASRLRQSAHAYVGPTQEALLDHAWAAAENARLASKMAR